MYFGYPSCLKAYHGSVFTSDRARNLTDMNVLQLGTSEVEAHDSLGIGEGWPEPLRTIYKKIKFNHPIVMPQN